MRCNSCCKFVSYDEPQCESQVDPEISNDSVTTSVEVSLNCAECGDQLKTATIDADATIEHDCLSTGVKALESWTEDDEQFEVVSREDPEGNSRQQTTDRHGKPIKSPRYMKTFYGFSQEVEVKCNRCGETFTVTLEGEEQASAFEEC